MDLNKPAQSFKIPVSALVVIHTPGLEVLLIERASHAGYWQSVTGSQEPGESLLETALRETLEETGIEAPAGGLLDWQRQNVYEIYPVWRHRYAPGVTHNTEHVFSLQLNGRVPVRLREGEHTQSVWLAHDKAAALCFSWSNRDALLDLPNRVRGP
ncbi:MAG: dihydroneopterin triphosphate diphosphatase [Betaproteobacteria bacterium]|nr:dihydroneopterin triphosphate diphosphatase [Betaproteobacteria bacterium]